MKQNNNNLMLEKNVKENTINETRKLLEKNECNDIGKVLERKCPICNVSLYYKHKEMLRRALKSNSLCHSCSRKENKSKLFKRICPKCKKEVFHTSKYSMKYALDKPCKDCSHIGLIYQEKSIDPKDLVRNCPVCGKEIQYKRKSMKKRADKENRICMHCVGNIAIKSKPPISDETREKLSKYRKGKTYKELGIICDLIKRGENISKRKTGIPFTKNHCLSLRKAKIKWLINNGFIFPVFNRKACEYLDNLGKEKGWNLQHALNGGEYYIEALGYWVDGYDKKRNIVVEYDEPFHNKPLRILKDENRMKEIKRYLQCQFYRYSVTKDELKEH